MQIRKCITFVLLSWSFSGQACEYTVKNIPIKYRENKNIYINPEAKAFCSEFALDYFYRLYANKETLYYPSKENPKQRFTRNRFSVKGALFAVGQVRVEAGWAKKGNLVDRNHNYWGIGGAYAKKGGGSTFAQFDSFEKGFAYTMLTLKRGIKLDGNNNIYHSGWPDFLSLMEKEDFSTDEANKALNSGPYCDTYPAYNTDRKHGSECIDYAGEIMKYSVKLVLQQCLASAKFHFDQVLAAESVVFKENKKDVYDKLDRRFSAIRKMKIFAMKNFPELFCK